MYFIILFILLQTIYSLTTYKTCQQCIFYIKPGFNNKYEIGNYFGKCIKFTNNDTIVGDFDYKYALIARLNENECGKEGKYHNKGEPANSCDFPSI